MADPPKTIVWKWDISKGERGNGPGVCDRNMHSYCGFSVGDTLSNGYKVTMLVREGTRYEAHLERN